MEAQDLLDPAALQENEDHLVQLDRKDHLEREDLMVKMENEAHPVLLVQVVHLEKEVQFAFQFCKL